MSRAARGSAPSANRPVAASPNSKGHDFNSFALLPASPGRQLKECVLLQRVAGAHPQGARPQVSRRIRRSRPGNPSPRRNAPSQSPSQSEPAGPPDQTCTSRLGGSNRRSCCPIGVARENLERPLFWAEPRTLTATPTEGASSPLSPGLTTKSNDSHPFRTKSLRGYRAARHCRAVLRSPCAVGQTSR